MGGGCSRCLRWCRGLSYGRRTIRRVVAFAPVTRRPGVRRRKARLSEPRTPSGRPPESRGAGSTRRGDVHHGAAHRQPPRGNVGPAMARWRRCPKAASSPPPTGSSRTRVAWSRGLVGRSLGGCVRWVSVACPTRSRCCAQGRWLSFATGHRPRLGSGSRSSLRGQARATA
jgi:hypothetical protein